MEKFNAHGKLDSFRLQILADLVTRFGVNVSFYTHKGQIFINGFGVAFYMVKDSDIKTPLINLGTDEMIDLLSYID